MSRPQKHLPVLDCPACGEPVEFVPPVGLEEVEARCAGCERVLLIRAQVFRVTFPQRPASPATVTEAPCS